MPLVVTGLSPNGDVSALKRALEAAGVPLDALQVVEASGGSAGSSRGLAGTELFSDNSPTGTGVPGLTSSYRPQTFFRDESLADRLGDLDIPDSQLDNYLEALDRGRSVVAYAAREETVDAVEAAFRSASLLNVRRF